MHESEVKVKSLSRIRLPATPWTAAYQAPLFMGLSRQEYWSGLPLPSPYFPASASFPMSCLFISGGQSIGASVSASVPPMNIQSWFKIDWFDFLAVQGTLKSLLQHHSSEASILQHSAFFMVQLLHPYMTTGKTIALTRWIFVRKVISLLFNILSRFIIAFLSRSKGLWISCLQSLSAVIYLENINSR